MEYLLIEPLTLFNQLLIPKCLFPGWSYLKRHSSHNLPHKCVHCGFGLEQIDDGIQGSKSRFTVVQAENNMIISN